MRRLLISLASILAFSTILTFYPDEFFTAILLYFVLFFGITIALGLRTYRKGVVAVKEISKGKPLFEIDEKEIGKIMEKDKELVAEYKRLTRSTLMPLLLLPAFMVLALILFPTLPPLLESTLGPVIGVYPARFFAYVLVFSIFSAISLLLFKPPTMPRIVRNVKIYEGGMVLDKVVGLKAPIEVEEYTVNPERRFIQFKLNNQIFRIYYKDVKELDGILLKIIKPLKQRSQ